jgi:hypothetical protein
MTREELQQEIEKSEDFKEIKECFDKLLSFTSDLFLRRDDHSKLNNALSILDNVLALALEQKIKEKLSNPDKNSPEY